MKREDLKREDLKREDVKREDVKREDVKREGQASQFAYRASGIAKVSRQQFGIKTVLQWYWGVLQEYVALTHQNNQYPGNSKTRRTQRPQRIGTENEFLCGLRDLGVQTPLFL